jgi:MFS transporter, PPP family, 3-phenylpropionic acid transporter
MRVIQRETLHPQASGFAARLSLFYGALFLVAGIKLPYFPVWLDERGLSTSEIAVIAAAPMFVRILGTPVIGFAADAWGDRRRAIVVLAWMSLVAFMALGPAVGFWPIFVITLLLSIATTGIMPLTETIAMSGVRAWRLDYGRMRLWGSLTFIAASFAAGMAVERAGAAIVLWLLAGGAILTVVSAHLLPGPANNADASATAEPALAPPSSRSSLGDVLALIASPAFALFIVAVGLVQAAHAVFYTFGVLHWQGQGISSGWAGVLWAVGVVAEIGLFAFSRRITEAIGSVALIGIGALAGLARWTLMAWEPPLALLVPLQALHGLTYGATHIGAVHWMSEHVPQARAGTAQAVYAAVTHGLAMGLATLLAGSLYGKFSGSAYLGMAVLSGVGLATTVVLARMATNSDRARP